LSVAMLHSDWTTVTAVAWEVYFQGSWAGRILCYGSLGDPLRLTCP
jgi:hypothetical protein